MRGVFDDNELKRAQARRDRELTLGTGSLLLILFGLIVVCGLCFGLGYSVGHRSGPEVAPDEQTPGGQGSSAAKVSPAKPLATAQNAIPPTDQSMPESASQPGVTNAPQSSAAATTPGVGAQGSAQQSAPASQMPASQPQVRPALAAEPAVQQITSASSALPAVPPAVPLMVQIAAVSHEEDAAVLVSALRKHGYAVSAQRNAADGLIHVRIGPFNDRNEANRWRLKLLNDGYNAMIQP